MVARADSGSGLPMFPCPVCDISPDVLPMVAESGEFRSCDCPICGRFRIDAAMMETLKGWSGGKRRLRAGLSSYIRRCNTAGETPRITWSIRASDIAESYCHTSVHTKLRRVMEKYEESTPEPGAFVGLDTEHDYPLFDAASRQEVEYLIGTLHQQGLIEFDEDSRLGYRITVPGWTFLKPLGGGVAGSCFVAMAFGDEFNAAYDEGILPALKPDCGFDSIRVDRVEHTDNINDKIIADIRRSQFLVADFTGHRQGVYFEAGFALGLGKTVIWSCGKRRLQGKSPLRHTTLQPHPLGDHGGSSSEADEPGSCPNSKRKARLARLGG
jgi:hypothetical protein